MSYYDDNMYQPSPASSSDVVDSVGGTTYTSPTAFSPEDIRVLKSATVNIGGDSAGLNQDPFVSSNAQIGAKLSAMASTFKPSVEMRAAAVSSTSVAIESSQKMRTLISSDRHRDLNGSKPQSGAPHEADSTRFGTFTTDSNTSRVLKVTGKNAVATFLSFVEASKRFRERGIAKRGSERAEQSGNSYYLRLANIRDATELYTGIKMDNPGLIVEYISPVSFGQLFNPGKYSVHDGQVLLTVNYPLNSTIEYGLLECSLVHMLEIDGKLYAWQKVSGTEDGTLYMLAEFEDASCALGAVTGSRKINSNPKLQNITVSVELFRPDLAEQVYSQQVYPPGTSARYQGEHIDLNDAFGNISLDNYTLSPGSAGTPHAGNLSAAPRMPYMATPSSYQMPNTLPFVMGVPSNLYMPPVANSFQQGYQLGIDAQATRGVGESGFHSFGSPSYTQDSFPQRGCHSSAEFQQSQLSNEFGYYNEGLHGQTRDLGQYGRSGRRPYVPRMQQHMRNRQHSNPANSHHNHVDIAKIKQGIDVRTTVMLRNIPNKVDQAMLKDIVDESSFGRYDFMYLRIDFSNNCNVGYAFINFTDPLDIVDFVVARSNQKWHKFKSDKVAEVSYATIQGKDCLVQKFRNSSVMLEPPHYRPKLFKTIHDEFGHAGEEENFPESDNASKLKRSCENAEHVGLFAPSAGQHLRDEQRRRRSQYDRGTSLAERDEDGFEDAFYSPFAYPPY